MLAQSAKDQIPKAILNVCVFLEQAISSMKSTQSLNQSIKTSFKQEISRYLDSN